MSLSEAMSLTSFTTLPAGSDDNNTAQQQTLPDPIGRKLLCTPATTTHQQSQYQPPGLLFRISNNNNIEAVQLIPPTLSSSDGDEEDEKKIQGGSLKIIGNLQLLDNTTNNSQVTNMACSNDARLLLLGYDNGLLVCYNICITGNNIVEVQFSKRWELQSSASSEVSFPTLEFLNGDNIHKFLAVIEPASTSNSNQVLWMDATTGGNNESPPTVNLWSNLNFTEDCMITCLTSGGEESTSIIFGTDTGKLGIITPSTTNTVQYVEHPLSNTVDGNGSYKVTHLHWLNSNSSLAVGLSRVIIDPDYVEDEDDEDDPNEHEVNLLIGTVEGNEWTWNELGDVVPFFSIPKGGKHVFHTAILPTSSSTQFGGDDMLLVGCNVASEVAILHKEESGASWDVLELMEGSEMSCPTNDDDEFLYLMGLGVSIVPTSLTSGEGIGSYPYPLLASTDGSLVGFIPQHKSLGGAYFTQQVINVVGDVTADMGVPLAVSQSIPVVQDSTASSPPVGSDNEGKCILSGLDLGLDGVADTMGGRPSINNQNDDDDDDNSDNKSASSIDSIDSEADADEDLPFVAPASTSTFMSGFNKASFSFSGGTSLSNTTSPGIFSSGGNSNSAAGNISFGGAPSSTTFGSAFGVTSSTFGATAAAPDKASTDSPPQRTPTKTTAPIFGSSATTTPVFGSNTTSQMGFGSLAAASSQSETKGFGSGKKIEVDEKEEPSKSSPVLKTENKEKEKPSQVASAAAPVFGSGSAPVFGFKSGGGFPTMTSIGEGSTNQETKTDPKTNPFGAFGSKSTTFGSSIAPGMAKPLFGNPSSTAAAETDKSSSAAQSSTVPASKTADQEPKVSEIDDDELKEYLKTQPGKKALEVFNNILSEAEDSKASSIPTTKFEALVEEIGEGFHGDELEKQLTLVDPDHSGKIGRTAFVKWYCNLVDQEGDDSSQESEVAEEKANAEEAFEGVSNGSSTIPASDFGKLIESMGTTYCEEEHRRTIKKISTVDESSGDKVISKKSFVSWYVDWLFGDDDSESEDDEESNADAVDEPATDSKETCKSEASEGWGSMFKSADEGSWKCGVCMVQNKSLDTICAACETAKPGEEGKSSTSSESTSAKPGSIGSSGFSFGGASTTATDASTTSPFGSSSIGSSGFSFGGSRPAESIDTKPVGTSGGFSFGSKESKVSSSTSTGIGSGGFSFGGAKPEEKKKNEENTTPTPSSQEESSELKEYFKTQPGKKALEVFNNILSEAEDSGASSLPTTKFEALVEEIGEGFHGDELDKQLALVDPEQSGKIGRTAFVKWYCNLVDQEGDDSSQESEVAEEKANAEEAFDGVSNGSSTIPASDFGKLIESMGTTYCEEEHRRTIKKISTVDESSGDKVISKKSFVSWYVDWLFGDDDSESEDDEESNADAVDEPATDSKETCKSEASEGWGSMFKSADEGSWKCGVCMVQNKSSDTICAACETAKPGEEGKSSTSSESTSAKPAAAGSIGSSGFSFGGASTTATDASKSESAFGSSSIGSSGFSFGGSKPAESIDTKPAVTSGGFSFGGTENKANSSTSTGIGSGGFSFGGAKPDEKKSEESTIKEKAKSDGYPPLATAAPKNPFAPKASGSSFPPMSSKAPTPFGGTTTGEEKKVKEKSVSSSAFPPMASAAPNNPFSTNKTSSSAAFPPMSATAPKPFGTVTKKEESKVQEKKKTSSSAAFPPMSSAAPKNPFSTTKPASSSSAFPPMSKTAPSPFGAFAKKEESKALSTSSSAAFPPMASAAPKNPFSTKPASSTTSSAAFPPMSKSAPSPFSAFSKKDEKKPSEKTSSSAAAFPPMSTAAPKPFGLFSKPKEDSSVPTPSPFSGFAAKKEETKAPVQTSSGAAFPPMSNAAPKNPFSASKPSSSSSAAAFPPMSKSAPKPFGVGTTKNDADTTKSKTTTASFPPMSATSPKPFGGIGSTTSTVAPATTTTNNPLKNEKKKEQPAQTFSVSSEYEAELWQQVSKFHEKTTMAKKLQQEVNSCIPSDLQEDIDSLVSTYQEKLSNSELFKSQNTNIQKRLLQLFSIQDDLTRQKKQSHIAIKEQTSDQPSSNLVSKEPLDAESEKKRRAIVSKCNKVQSLISTVEDRLSMNKEIFSCSTEAQDEVRPSDYFNQWSRSPPPKSRKQTAKGATTFLLKSLTTGYDKVRDFDSFSQHISEQATQLKESQESKNQGTANKSVAKRTTIKTRLGSRTIISPRPTSHLRSPLTRRSKPGTTNETSILERHKCLRQMNNTLFNDDRTAKTFYLRGQMGNANQSAMPDWRSKGKNELLSTSKATMTNLVPKLNTTSSAVAKTLFSSPMAGTTARSDWTSGDQGLLKINIPQQLKQINHADAAKEALSKFGTTPEELAKGRDIISRDEAESKVPLKIPSVDKPSASLSSKTSTFPSQSSKPAFGGLTKSTTSAAFPPMPTRSPKPLSQSLNQDSKPTEATTTSSTSTSPTQLNVDYKKVLTKFYQENDRSKVNEVDERLNRYKGKEAEMFVSIAKKYNKPNALNVEFETRVKDIDQSDYLALLTLFIQVFNPSRVSIAEKYLNKYKVSYVSLSLTRFALNHSN